MKQKEMQYVEQIENLVLENPNDTSGILFSFKITIYDL